jgi:hypothetical protein
MKPLGAKWLVKLYDHLCSNLAIIGRRTFAPNFQKCERTFAPLITNPFVPRILPYLYFHRRFIEPFCASTFRMYMHYRVSTFYSSHRLFLYFWMSFGKYKLLTTSGLETFQMLHQSRTDTEHLDFVSHVEEVPVRKDNEGKIYPLGTNIRLERHVNIYYSLCEQL